MANKKKGSERPKCRQVQLECSCGGKTSYTGSERFCRAVKEQFAEDHRDHSVRVVKG